MLVTDMNNRERNTFAEKAEKLAAVSNQLAIALRSEDDSEVLLRVALVGVAGSFMNDLNEIFAHATGVIIPDSPSTLANKDTEDKK